MAEKALTPFERIVQGNKQAKSAEDHPGNVEVKRLWSASSGIDWI
jgi:hypothetical protein